MHHLKQVSSGGKVGRGRWFFPPQATALILLAGVYSLFIYLLDHSISNLLPIFDNLIKRLHLSCSL